MKRTLILLMIVAFAGPASAKIGAPGSDGSQHFARPAELAPDIQFWRRIYAEVTTQGGLIHDSRHLQVVYEKVEMPEGSTRRQWRKAVREKKEHYREILRTLAKGKRNNLSTEQRRVLALWPDGVSNKTLRQASHRVRFQLGQADKFRAGLIRSGAWEDHIRSTLSTMGLPGGLAALPHVESSFNPNARSHVGAAGLWQFTRSTGQRYMRIDHVVDERLDPFISTKAAARLLKHNYSVLGTWPLAITAYNHGAAGMRRAVRKLNTHDIAEIVRHYRSRTFGFASRNFYVAFLAAWDVASNAQQFFGTLSRDERADHQKVGVPDYMRADTVAEALGVSLDELREHNLALQRTVWDGSKFIPRGYELHVPQGAVDKPAQRLAQVGPGKRFVRQRPDRFHRVRRGQTLSMIASRYNVGVRKLVRLNGLRSRHFIRAGQSLRLPGADATVPTVLATQTPKQAQPVPEDGTYKVERGDTLWEIAKRYDTQVSTLARLNDLADQRRLYPGQRLSLVAKAEPKQEAAGTTQTTTRPEQNDTGDTRASAEPESATVASAMPQLSADPSDYVVAEDDTIEVQAAETLGHYAEWLELRTWRLRRLNGMRYGQPVVVGHRLELDFSNVDQRAFQERRMAYHKLLQDAFFQKFEITGTQTYRIRRGDSLWTLAQRHEQVPVWLLRQYNPDLDFTTLQVGSAVEIPQVTHRPEADIPADGSDEKVAAR